MIHVRLKILLLCTMSLAHANDHISPFDAAIQEILQQNPEQNSATEQPSTQLPSSPKQDHHFLDYETCSNAIDFIALTTAMFRVYNRYQRIYGPPVESDWWEKTWNSVCPELIIDAGQHSKLFKETLEIAFETVTLKTVAKLVLFCWKGDGVGMLKATVSKIGRFFSLLR